MDSQIKSQLDDEVDLLGLFITIWNNKSKVFFYCFCGCNYNVWISSGYKTRSRICCNN